MSLETIELYKQLTTKRIKIILSGYVDADFANEIDAGIHPSVDVINFQRLFGAKICDFHWLEKKLNQKSRFKHWLSSKLMKLYGWSGQNAIEVYKHSKNDDLIYATNEDVGLPLAALFRFHRVEKTKLMLRIEQFSFGRNIFFHYVHKYFMRYAVKRIDLFLCRSPKHIEILVNDFKVHRSKAIYAPEPIDINYFNMDATYSDPVAVDIPDKPYILSAGLEMRDYDTLLVAVKDLSVHVIIGAGSPWSHFRFSSGEQEIPPHVSVDSFTRLQMRELYRSAKAVVVPVKPTERTCGISVALEALSMTRPVIASCTQGLTAYLEDGVTCYLCPPTDPVCLRETILYVLSNPEEAEQLAQAGHDHIMSYQLDEYTKTVGVAAAKLLGIL